MEKCFKNGTRMYVTYQCEMISQKRNWLVVVLVIQFTRTLILCNGSSWINIRFYADLCLLF